MRFFIQNLAREEVIIKVEGKEKPVELTSCLCLVFKNMVFQIIRIIEKFCAYFPSFFSYSAKLRM